MLSSGDSSARLASAVLLKTANSWKNSLFVSGSYLWSWHWQHAIDVPIHTVIVVLTRSTMATLRNSSASRIAALAVRHRVAVERRGDELLVGRIRQEVAGQLLDGELVERLVLVEGADDVIAVEPDGPRRVVGVAGRVGVAGQVEPHPRPVLAERVLRQQAVHHFLVGVGALVGDERVHLGRRRRQAGQVERDAANERFPVRFGRMRQALALQPGQDEAVDRVTDPRLVLDGGRVGPDRRDVRPVRLVLGAGRHPAFQHFLLPVGQGFLRAGRRHHLGRLVPENTVNQLAFIGITRDDGPLLDGGVALVQAQPGLARPGVGAVAGEAVLRQDGADVAVVRRRGSLVGAEGGRQEAGGRQAENGEGRSHGGFHAGLSRSRLGRVAWRVLFMLAAPGASVKGRVRGAAIFLAPVR